MDKKPHGSYKAEVRNGISYVWATGPFNEDIVQIYMQEKKDLFQTLGSSWGQILIFSGVSVFIPEAMELLGVSFKRSERAGMTRIAIIIEDTPAYGITKQQMEEHLSTLSLRYSFHESVGSAETWLAENQYTGLSCTPRIG